MILTGTGAAPVLAALHAACFPPGETWDEAAMAELLAMPGCFAATGGRDDAPAALALARVAADQAELLTLGVRPAARRRGLGRLVLRELAHEAAVRGARTLFLEVSERNRPALDLYRGAGFAAVGRRARYYGNGDDALVLARALERTPGQPGEPAVSAA